MIKLAEPAVQVALNAAARAMREKKEQLAAANRIIAEQNAVIAKAYSALLFAFDNMTTSCSVSASSNVAGLKKIAAVLAEIEGAKR